MLWKFGTSRTEGGGFLGESRRDIVVVGASLGGVEAMTFLVSKLPAEFPAAVFVVVHIGAVSHSFLPEILTRAGALPARHPEDGEHVLRGCVYIAPPDRHLMLDDDGVIRVIRGPLENGHRPAVDALFRSAARVYGPRVIGVVLTGARDCGTAGLYAVKKRRGLAIVQDPLDAMCAEMPRNAIENVEVDHVVLLADLPALLGSAVAAPLLSPGGRDPSANDPEDPIVMESRLVMNRDATTDEERDDDGGPGELSAYGCPDCGGVLREIDETKKLRYRCRVGHGYSSDALQDAMSDQLDAALWVALRNLQESASLSRRLARRAVEAGHRGTMARFVGRAERSEEQAKLIRDVLESRSADPPPPPYAPDVDVRTRPEGEKAASLAFGIEVDPVSRDS